MRTVEDHLRNHPRALPSTLAFIEKRNAVLQKLQDEVARRQAPSSTMAPSRKPILDRVVSWLGRRA